MTLLLRSASEKVEAKTRDFATMYINKSNADDEILLVVGEESWSQEKLTELLLAPNVGAAAEEFAVFGIHECFGIFFFTFTHKGLVGRHEDGIAVVCICTGLHDTPRLNTKVSLVQKEVSGLEIGNQGVEQAHDKDYASMWQRD